MADLREGFYAFFYTGKEGAGNILICFKGGRLVGIDPIGGKITGSYVNTATGIDGDVTFNFAPGTLVTGQVLLEPMVVGTKISLPANVFSGEVARVDIGMGPINARAVFITEPI